MGSVLLIFENVISPCDRAMASALFNLVMSVTGDAPGPWIVGQVRMENG